MASQDFLPRTDAALNTWLANFAAKCNQYDSELGLTSTELLEISNFATDFAAVLKLIDEMKESLKGEVAGKNSLRSNATADVRAYAKRFKAIAGISPTILSSLGIVSNSSSGPVVTVNGLVVTGCSDGINFLKWNRNGNGPNTQFIIESSETGAGNWEFVSVTTKTSFNHEDQIPGEQQFYRIKSNRAGVTSNPCMPVVVYPSTGSGTIQLAA